MMGKFTGYILGCAVAGLVIGVLLSADTETKKEETRKLSTKKDVRILQIQLAKWVIDAYTQEIPHEEICKKVQNDKEFIRIIEQI